MEEIKRNCELCRGEASLYCPSDDAFLCYTCDSKVHCANFLVARHVRSLICPCCRNIDGNRFSGAGVPPPATLFCKDCSGGEDSLSSSSSCISSTGEGAEEAGTTSSRKREMERGGDVKRRRRERGTVAVVDLKVEGVLVNWCRRMGVVEEREIGQVVNMAVELISGCLDGITVLPFRVSLAASFWVAVRVVCCRGRRGGGGGGLRGASACQDLKSVEQISGVPAKLILATEAKLARVIRRRRSREDHEEGWAEC